jgi:hypothetical protein
VVEGPIRGSVSPSWQTHLNTPHVDERLLFDRRGLFLNDIALILFFS